MSTLSRHLLRQNLFFLLLSLLACVGIYLLVDVFERLDKFLEHDAAVETALVYFLSKIPLIVSQVLPAVFLITVVVQITWMHRSRELVALEAGGVAYGRVIAFFLVYALLWSGLQLLFSQQFGIAGEVKSERIMDSLGKEPVREERVLRDIWFKSGRFIVHIGAFRPKTGEGSQCRVAAVAEGFTEIERIYRAERFRVESGSWTLIQGSATRPRAFEGERFSRLELPVGQDPAALAPAAEEEAPERLPIWDLGRTIDRLERAGINTEALRTAWHMKLAYAASILVMAMIGLILSKQRQSLFLNLVLGIVLTFLFYFLYAFGGTMGEKGILPAWAGGWFGNLAVGGPALGLLLRQARR